jgi:HAD superfamily hydrolase (TIGR01459 family)
MKRPETPLCLAAISGGYDTVLCDIWGVVHDGGKAYPAAITALQAFRAAGGAVVLVSNVPKPRDPIFEQLRQRGVPRDAFDTIVTSGDAIRKEFKARAPGPMLKIGPPRYDDDLWAGLDLDEADLEGAAFLAVSGLRDPERETPADYAPLLERAKARGLDLVCANPDIVVRVGDRLIWCAGALARDYDALGGRVVMAGKPHAAIYDLAYQEAQAALGRRVGKSQILAIGDGPVTDVLGANREGLDCLFIAGGVNEWARADGFTAAGAARALAEHGVHARYAMPALA